MAGKALVSSNWPIAPANDISRRQLCEAAKQNEEISLRHAHSMDERPPGRYDTRQGSFQAVERTESATTVGTGTTLHLPPDSISSLSPRAGRQTFSAAGFNGQDNLSQPSIMSRSFSVSTIPGKCSCHAGRLEKVQAGEVGTSRQSRFLLDECR